MKADTYALSVPATRLGGSASKKKGNILKRLWWCCIIRDRIMPLCVRRSVQISRHQFDFNSYAPLNEEDLSDEIHRSTVYDPASKRVLITILATLIELCTYLTDTLEIVYPPKSILPTEDLAFCRKDTKVQHCREGLRRWYNFARLLLPLVRPDNDDEAPCGTGTGSHNNLIMMFSDMVWIYY